MLPIYNLISFIDKDITKLELQISPCLPVSGSSKEPQPCICRNPAGFDNNYNYKAMLYYLYNKFRGYALL